MIYLTTTQKRHTTAAFDLEPLTKTTTTIMNIQRTRVTRYKGPIHTSCNTAHVGLVTGYKLDV